jgi:hypothetical protein
MIDHPALDDIPTPDGAAPRVAALEERVRQLEQTVAALQDTRALEERVVERVATQVKPSPSAGVRESAGLLLQAGRHLLPAAVSVLSEQAAPVEAPAPTAGPPPAAPLAAPRQPWLLFSVYAEFRAILRMYLDPRFRLTWQGRLAPVILLPAIALSWFWLPGTAVLSALPFGIDRLYVKIVDLLLAFVLFHILHREATRYRTTSPDLPPSLRL